MNLYYVKTQACDIENHFLHLFCKKMVNYCPTDKGNTSRGYHLECRGKLRIKVRHPEYSEGSPKLVPCYGLEIPRCTQDDVLYYICLMIACAKPEQLTQVAPSIRRSKSYVTVLASIAPSTPLIIKSAASTQPK